MSDLRGHENQNPKAVHGSRPAPHKGDTYKSTIKMSHPTIRPQTNYQERKRGSTSVPVPPELKLP